MRMFPPNVIVLLWELCGADRSMRLVSKDWRDRLPAPAMPACIRLVAAGHWPWKCRLPAAWKRVDRVELCVCASFTLAKKRHGHRARLTAALRDVMRDVSDVRSMLVYAPGCVVSTNLFSRGRGRGKPARRPRAKA